MSLLERVQNVLIGIVTEATHKIYSIRAENRLARSSSGEYQLRLSLLQYAANAGAVVANVAPPLDFAHPTAPLLLPVAGVTIDDAAAARASPLDDAWRSLADESTRGFVLVTFGAIAKTSELPSQLWKALLNGMQRHGDVTFVLKHEDEMDDGPRHWQDNVWRARWLPQLQLMCE